MSWALHLKHLLALALALLAAPVMSQSFEERTAGIIGILPLPEVFGGGACDRFEPRDIPIFRSPASGRPFGKIYVAKYWIFPQEGGCEGLVVQSGLRIRWRMVANYRRWSSATSSLVRSY
ncbi:MAG: hypothetical protein EXR70_22700 [Deltaproteobacteria bacterium]|nr:hypothetical protein [Deltaproteobacteria bacterium]